MWWVGKLKGNDMDRNKWEFLVWSIVTGLLMAAYVTLLDGRIF